MIQMQKYCRKVLLTSAIALILTSFSGSFLQVLAENKPDFSRTGQPPNTTTPATVR